MGVKVWIVNKYKFLNLFLKLRFYSESEVLYWNSVNKLAVRVGKTIVEQYEIRTFTNEKPSACTEKGRTHNIWSL